MIYDKKVFWKSLFMVVGVMGLMYLTKGSGFVVVLPLAFAAFFKKRPEVMLFYVATTMTMLIGNGYLMPKNQIFMFAQKGILVGFGVISLMTIASRKYSPCLSPFLLVMPYLVFSIFPSAVGWAPIVSFLKLILFFLVIMSLLGVANEVIYSSRAQLPKLRAMIFALVTFIILGSILLIPFPAISQLQGEEYLEAVAKGQVVTSLFKGMTFHSQSLGPLVAYVATFVFADWALAVRKKSYLHLLVLCMCPILIFKTSSRTAMGAFLFGLLCVSYCVMRERGIGIHWRAKVKTSIFLIATLLAVSVAVVPSLRDGATKYLLKGAAHSTDSVTVTQIMSSRQGLIDEAIHNFKKSPIIGNGFQVNTDKIGWKAKSWKDYLSAPVEKGVWVIAILEEGGVVGMTLFLVFVVGVGTQLFIRRAYISFSLFATFLVSNLGEFTIFSTSGAGGFYWTLLLIGAAFDALRLRDDNVKRMFGDYS